MKILFWTDGFWPRIGGTETQGMEFIEGMQSRGHSFTVIAQKDTPYHTEDEIYKGTSIRRFDFNAIIEKKNLKIIASIQNYLHSVRMEFQPDIIYLNTFSWGSSFVFLLFRQMFSIPAIATSHAPHYVDKMPNLTVKICNQLDHICCVSDWALRTMKNLIPSQKSKLKRIYCALSEPKNAPTPLSFSPPTILILGRLSSEKGFDTAIEAFALLKNNGSDAKLLIAGEGSERPFLEHLVDRFNIRHSVEFTGKLERTQVYSTINQATFVVVPSHLEAFGLVALESLQMKRPVIASNVGSLPEIITHRLTGLLAPPQNPVAFYEAMKEFIQNPEETKKMGERGFESSKQYSLQSHLDQYENLFREYNSCH